MRKLVPILLLVLGLAGGAGAGFYLRPPPALLTELPPCGPDPNAQTQHEAKEGATQDDTSGSKEYVKLNNQFVIPVVQDDTVSSLVVISLNIEVKPGYKEEIYAREPRLRDALLRAMFDHANIGGFRGAFTNSSNLDILRISLRETAKDTIGQGVLDVLIMDIARQDI